MLYVGFFDGRLVFLFGSFRVLVLVVVEIFMFSWYRVGCRVYFWVDIESSENN